jgi:hypothetical protein
MRFTAHFAAQRRVVLAMDSRLMTSAETAELCRLLDQLTVASAVEASAGHATGPDFEHFKQLDDRVSEITARIQKLLG